GAGDGAALRGRGVLGGRLPGLRDPHGGVAGPRPPRPGGAGETARTPRTRRRVAIRRRGVLGGRPDATDPGPLARPRPSGRGILRSGERAVRQVLKLPGYEEGGCGSVISPSCAISAAESVTPQCSTIFPSAILCTAIAVTSISLPVGGIPASSPSCRPRARRRVTTLSPSAT